MKDSILLFAFCFLGFGSIAMAQNSTATTSHKVVIQLNSADTAAWGGVIGNIKNLSKIWPEHLQIEVTRQLLELSYLLSVSFSWS